MKKKKTKAEKRMAKARRAILMNIDTDKLGEHFCEIFNGIWSEVCKVKDDDSEDVDMMNAIAEYCKTGWNAAVISDTIEEAMEYIDGDLAGAFPEEAEPVIDMIKFATTLKFHVYPDDRVPVKNVAILLEEGEPSISVVFDLEAAETRARQMAVDLPSIDEILDHDAIQRAVEGVPKEQMEAALNTEIQRQIDVYNNTPQEALGGISPDEAYRRKQKS